MEILYVLFGLSVFLPVYTYAIYPVILLCMKRRSFRRESYVPAVTVVILGSEEAAYEKRKNISGCDYSEFEIIVSDEIRDSVNKAKGDILIFTDTETEFDKDAIREIVVPFFDERIGAVVGMQCAKNGNSAFWKYENKVRMLESKMGCVSGANASIFAVRKSEMPAVHESVKNKMFFTAMGITQAGKDIVYEPKAIAYERVVHCSNFNKHTEDAIGYWQALCLFPKMLLPRKGSFVYISHRVMKWFVWLNLLIAFIVNIVMAFMSKWMAIVLICQCAIYTFFFLFGKKGKGLIGKLCSIGRYFVLLNLSYATGLLHALKRK